MRHFKIKFQYLTAYRTVLMIFQIIVDRCAKPRKCAHKRIYILFHLTIFTFSFECEQFLIAFIQISGNPFVICLDSPFQFQKIFLAQHCAVHIPPAFYQIVRLVDQKNIFPPDPFRKKSAQVHMRIEQIIIVADDCIGKKTHIKTHFKGADHMPFRIFFYFFPVEDVLVYKQIIHCLVDSVIMSLGVRAVFRITFRLFHETDLVLCCQDYTL